MAFDRITDGDLLGKGNLGRPDTPGVDTAEMQRILDELPREVIVPAFNRLADQLEAADAAASLGAARPESLSEDTPATVQGVLEAILNKNEEHIARTDNPHAVTAAQTGAYTKEETDAAIDQRVVQIGAGDMTQAVYDPTGRRRDVFAAIGEAVNGAGHMEKSVYAAAGEPGAVDRALSADKALAADDGVKVYTHTKSGTVHNFAGTGANGRAKMTADVQAGDTFTVNGAPVTAYMGTELAADTMAGSAWNGKWVSFIVEGGTLNFKGGGGLAAADKEKLIPENIREGVVLFAGTPREVVGTLYPAPEPGTFVGYTAGGAISDMLGGLGGNLWLFNSEGIKWYPGSGGQGLGWFTNRLDMSRYKSIFIHTTGYSHEGLTRWTFGVSQDTNRDSYEKSIDITVGQSPQSFSFDVTDVSGLCYIKWQTNDARNQYITKIEVSV